MLLFLGPHAQQEYEHEHTRGWTVARGPENSEWRIDSEVRGDDEEEVTGWRCGQVFVPDSEVTLLPSRVCWVSAYHVGRAFGGPEEGGWYYDYGALLVTYATTEDEAPKIRELVEKEFSSYKSDIPLYSVSSDGDLSVEISDFPGASYPATIPHYE